MLSNNLNLKSTFTDDARASFNCTSQTAADNPIPSLKQSDLPIETHTYSGPSQWRPGQPYRYPVPKPEGDPWEIVLAPLLKKDKLQCAAWKEQIHSILVVVKCSFSCHMNWNH